MDSWTHGMDIINVHINFLRSNIQKGKILNLPSSTQRVMLKINRFMLTKIEM